MSQKHPIISITGSSGAGTLPYETPSRRFFVKRYGIHRGGRVYRFDNAEMKRRLAEAQGNRLIISRISVRRPTSLRSSRMSLKHMGKPGTGGRVRMCMMTRRPNSGAPFGHVY